VIGARVIAVLGWWDYYFTQPGQIWQLSLDGLSLWGGLVCGGAVALARLGRDGARQPSRARLLDIAVPNALLGIALGRLGAFLDGHGQGVPAQLPWATQYSHALAATPDFGVPRHPVQLYELLIALASYVLCQRLPRAAPPGARAALGTTLYAGARVVLGPVRGEPSFLFGLQIEQLVALLVLAYAGWLGIRLGVRAVPRSMSRSSSLAPAATGQQRPKEDSMAA
jgi:prolipoprotein diacylglyceryltransferase